MKQRIPKIIHYVWVGGRPLSELAEKCIESWKKYCPDYKIIRWDESNFDMNFNDYVKEAYEEKKWAFVSDVIRLYALVNYGGIYMDTDVEVLKPLDDLLQYEAVSGFESKTNIPTGLMASVKNQSMMTRLLNGYDGLHFKRLDGSLDLTPNTEKITKECLALGLELNNIEQTVDGFTLLSSEYLCPLDPKTRKLTITQNTYTIHHFNGSWMSDEMKYYMKELLKYKKFMPNNFASNLASYKSVAKYQGRKVAWNNSIQSLKKKMKKTFNEENNG